MSIGVLDASSEFPDKWGPDKGYVELVLDGRPSLEVPNGAVSLSNFYQSMDLGDAALRLFRSYPN